MASGGNPVAKNVATSGSCEAGVPRRVGSQAEGARKKSLRGREQQLNGLRRGDAMRSRAEQSRAEQSRAGFVRPSWLGRKNSLDDFIA